MPPKDQISSILNVFMVGCLRCRDNFVQPALTYMLVEEFDRVHLVAASPI